MAEQANCPNCNRASLVHTGAFWICPRCGLMITKHALATETMRLGRGEDPCGNPTNDTDPPGTGKD